MPLDTEVGLGPGHIVLDGDPAPLTRGTAPPPYFSVQSMMSIVTKWWPSSATAESLFRNSQLHIGLQYKKSMREMGVNTGLY